jgi:4,5-DOPA dioxygenase extradiol
MTAPTDVRQPSIMYQHDHPAFKQLQLVGAQITQRVRPKAVVVVSAHWQAAREGIEVNTALKPGLIYESVPRQTRPDADSRSFYGFPDHYYRETFEYVGSPSLAADILGLLQDSGIKAKGTSRGLDHGVWSSFKVGEYVIGELSAANAARV